MIRRQQQSEPKPTSSPTYFSKQGSEGDLLGAGNSDVSEQHEGRELDTDTPAPRSGSLTPIVPCRSTS